MSDLFRREAMEQQRNRVHGDVLVRPKLSHPLLLAACAVWTIAVAVWLLHTTYSPTERVPGWLAHPPNPYNPVSGDHVLVAYMLLPARCADSIFPGQILDIRFGAPASNPLASSLVRVAAISKLVVVPEDSLYALRESVYLLRARPLETREQELALTQGMPLSVDIRLAKRPLREWLLEQILPSTGSSQ